MSRDQDDDNIFLLPIPKRPTNNYRKPRGERVRVVPEFAKNAKPIDLDAVVHTIECGFQEFIETIDNLIDVHHNLLDTGPERLIPIFEKYINILNEMKEEQKKRSL